MMPKDILAMRFAIDNESEFPAYEISVRVWDMDKVPTAPKVTLEDITLSSLAIVNIPSLAPHVSQIIGPSVEIPSGESIKKFAAQFSCRVGGFFQKHPSPEVGGVWLFCNSGAPLRRIGGTHYRKVDNGYPLNSKGDVDW